MLYKFKSRAAADLILLEPQGRQILEIIGKTPGPTGIVTAAQIPAALAALEAAVARDEARLRAAQVAAQQERVLPMRTRLKTSPTTPSTCASAPRLSSTCCAAASKRAVTWCGGVAADAP